MPLFVYLVPDRNANDQEVAYGIVKDERGNTLSRLFSSSSDWITLASLKTIVVDKGLNEISTVTEVYDHASVILCRFNFLKAMKSGTAEHCRTDKPDFVRDDASKMVYSATESMYFESYHELNRECRDFAKYFQRVCHSLKESWAGFATVRWFITGIL